VQVSDDRLEVIAPENPVRLEAGATETMNLFVNAPRDVFVDGKHEIELSITDGVDFDEQFPYTLLGPFERSPAAGESG
jgi:hypothetical protein